MEIQTFLRGQRAHQFLEGERVRSMENGGSPPVAGNGNRNGELMVRSNCAQVTHAIGGA